MNLFFLRHGPACARSRKWSPDATRPLTRDGEKKIFEVAHGMQTLDLSFDLILTSPYIRAFRTAEILAEVFKSEKVLETKHLIAEAEPEAVIDEINEKFPVLKQIVLVGHEPFMTRLICVLLAGKEALSIELRKGGCCKLSVNNLRFGACASLEWLMTPRQLAKLAKH
jgi:phosphohistidine phosphatase